MLIADHMSGIIIQAHHFNCLFVVVYLKWLSGYTAILKFGIFNLLHSDSIWLGKLVSF